MKKTQAMEKMMKKMGLEFDKLATKKDIIETVNAIAANVVAEGEVKEGAIEFGIRNFAGIKMIIAKAVATKMNCELTLDMRFGKKQLVFKGIKANVDNAKVAYAYMLDHCVYVERKVYLDLYTTGKDSKKAYNKYTEKLAKAI